MNEVEKFLATANLEINDTIMELAIEAQRKGSNYYKPFMLLMKARFEVAQVFIKGEI